MRKACKDEYAHKKWEKAFNGKVVNGNDLSVPSFLVTAIQQ